jgi:hypothetical protein
MYPNALGSDGRTVQSTVDQELPFAELKRQFPLFAERISSSSGDTAALEVELRPGQALFIPAFWWHQVTSVEPSVSMNVFWGDQGTNVYTSKVVRLCSAALEHWLLNIVEQNRKVPGGAKAFAEMLVGGVDASGHRNGNGRNVVFKTGDGLDFALSQFLFSQWHEELSQLQLDHIRATVIAYLRRTHNPSCDAFSLIDLELVDIGGGGVQTAALGLLKAKLKIRGLRNRGGGAFEEDAETMKAERASVFTSRQPPSPP